MYSIYTGVFFLCFSLLLLTHAVTQAQIKDADHNQAILCLMAEYIQVPPIYINICTDPIVVKRPTSPPSASYIPYTLNLFFNSKLKTAFLKFRFSIGTD